MKLKHIPIVLSLLGTTVCLLSAQTNATDPSSAPAATTPSTTAPATTPAPAAGDSSTPASGDTSASGERPATYTMVSGDSCWSIAQKFGISVRALEKANNLTKSDVKKLRPGKVLKIPALPASASPTPEKTTSTSSSSDSSPVASTAEGSPTSSSSSSSISSPSPTTEVATSLPKPKRKKSTGTTTTQSTTQKPDASSTDTTVTSTDSQTATNSIVSGDSPVFGDYYHPAAPTAKPVKPTKTAKLAKTVKPAPPTQMASTSTTTTTSSAAMLSSSLSNKQIAEASIGSFSAPAPIIPRSKGFFGFFQHDDTEEQTGWAARFHQSAEDLASHHIGYGQSWHPPGEPRSWVMDCSNTSRYIYKVTANLDLPRTASDQYYYLHLQNKAWDVPSDANNNPDVSYLRAHLKPGDLLFWENTYRPERQPPITHVMIFLGQDGQGRWLMAGSQSGHDGEHRHTGPDIYKFDPLAPSGGYTTWMGFVHHKGRFTAFGRPLAADPTKLASN